MLVFLDSLFCLVEKIVYISVDVENLHQNSKLVGLVSIWANPIIYYIVNFCDIVERVCLSTICSMYIYSQAIT